MQRLVVPVGTQLLSLGLLLVKQKKCCFGLMGEGNKGSIKWVEVLGNW